MNCKGIILGILTLLAGSMAASAQASCLRFGLEWGADMLLASSHHFNYIVDSGTRVDEQDGGMSPALCGSVMAFAGTNVGEKLSFCLYGGFAGLDAATRMIPVLVRTNWYPKTCDADGFFGYMDIGTDCKSLISSKSLLADLGVGQRLALSRLVKMDVMLGLRTLQQTPPIADPNGTGNFIPAKDIRVSHAGYYSLCLSLALEF